MSGYSPAMIEQATSMALTIAHHTGRTAFAWDDLVEAVTTLDAGTAIGIRVRRARGTRRLRSTRPATRSRATST